MYAKVIVDVSSSHVDTEFEYRIPSQFENFVKPGARVIVSFGVREIFGFVLEVYQDKCFDGESKDITDLLDYSPIITEEQLELAKHINKTTTSLMISCLNLMIPDSLKGRTDKFIQVNHYESLDAELAIAFGGKKRLRYDNNFFPLHRKIKKALDQNHLEIVYVAKAQGGIKKIDKYRIKQGYFDSDFIEIRNVRKRDILYALLQQDIFLTVQELCEIADCSNYMIKSLIDLGYFDHIQEEVFRNQRTNSYHTKKHIVDESNKLLSYLNQTPNKPLFCHFSNNKQATSSYLDIIGKQLQQQKKVLFIVPNFLLVTQYYMLFSSRFVANIGLFDSSISKGEYYDAYRQLVDGTIDIAIGTKKAGFLPIEPFDLIIVDGEESLNYISDQSPRYHLLDVLVHRSIKSNIPFIMSSISPSIERYEKALRGEYRLYEASRSKLPRISVVDMKQELKEGNRSVLSTPLQEEISNRLVKKEQTVIILNHKGYSQFVICRMCGHVIKCPKCKVSLKYSKHNNQLECGYCTYKEAYPNHCPKCQSTYIRQMGYGLEQLEEKLREQYPNASILRVDGDLNKSSQSYIEVLRRIEEQDVDIIIGTEVLIRLLTYDSISLIAILSADFMLSLPDYKSRELTYQMISQAVSKLESKTNSLCLIQAYESNHFVIHSACTKNHLEFIEKEYQYRNDGFYPPFSKVHRVVIKGPYKETFKVANTIKKTLYASIKVEKQILGPTVNDKINAVQLIVKLHPDASVDQLYSILYQEYQASKYEIYFERYPISLS